MQIKPNKIQQASRPAFEAKIQSLHQQKNFSAAFEMFLSGYGTDIWWFLLGKVRDQQEAQEVYQHTLTNIWKGFPNFEWRSTLRTWAYLIARHTLSRHQSGLPYNEEELNSQHDKQASSIISMTSQIQNQRNLDMLIDAMSKLLNDDERKVIYLYYSGMSFQEIAEELSLKNNKDGILSLRGYYRIYNGSIDKLKLYLKNNGVI
jgi:RNA polymerase sigma-70 factor, ECF subfamily